jgi:histidinol-phosphate phosphatase family protein
MPEKILVVRLGSLGDVILASATVLNLKINFPESEVVFLTRRQFVPVVDRFDGVDRVRSIPDHPGMAAYARELFTLDEENFDTVVDLHGNLRSWLARKTISRGESFVYPKRRLERMRIVKTHRIPRQWPHTIDLYNDCVRQLGGRSVAYRPIIPLTSPERNSAIGSEERPIVVVAPGAAHPNKQWEIGRFYETARTLNRSLGAEIVWVITGTDVAATESLTGIPASDFRTLIDQPIEKLIPVFSSASVTIANDSGLMHLSSAVGTPVVAVFGPTHPALGFSPRGQYDRVIEVDEYCRPCSLHGKKPCFRKERFCFTRIAPDEVAAAAAELIADRKRQRGLLVDRDGTVMINKHYPSSPEQVELVPGAAAALRKAGESGYRIAIISNQSGVARGYFGIEEIERVNGRLLELLAREGVEIEAVYFCPYFEGGTDSAYGRESRDRKPAPGMAERAAEDLGIDLRSSVVIGDSQDDYNLGRVIGAQSILVRTGYGCLVERRLKKLKTGFRPIVCDDLSQAIERMLEGRTSD